MAAVKTMVYAREKSWHGLGIRVEEPTLTDALCLARLGWQVVQQPIYTDKVEPIPGCKANVCDSDRKVLGVVTDR